MGMGHGSVPVIFIEEENIRKLNLISYELFRAMTERLGFDDQYDMVDVLEYGVDSAYDFQGHSADTLKKYIRIYNAFQEEFKQHTGVGIFIQYHDSEGIGSVNDDVDGIFYHLNYSDVFEMTSQGASLKEKVDFEKKYYVVHS